MLNKKMQDALNKQITREMYASNLYLSMAAYFAAQNLNGFASWMKIQAEEETQHALKIFDFMLDRGGQPIVSALTAPPTKWKTPLEAFEAAYEHEQLVTGWIYELVEISLKEKDYATHAMLQWFVNEQVEEEANTSQIVDKLKLIGNNNNGLFLIDNELGNRTAPPTV